jgi:diadenosine tetraphosphate (Ap4A) HIT family hydrolase
MTREHGFELHERLEADCYEIGDLPLCRVLLMDDARYPWLILVPRRADVAEFIDLPVEERLELMEEIALAQKVIRDISGPDKINVGALGNMVRQLHVHVIARFVSDEAWPGPVWGQGERRAYPPHMAGPLIDKFEKALGISV